MAVLCNRHQALTREDEDGAKCPVIPPLVSGYRATRVRLRENAHARMCTPAAATQSRLPGLCSSIRALWKRPYHSQGIYLPNTRAAVKAQAHHFLIFFISVRLLDILAPSSYKGVVAGRITEGHLALLQAAVPKVFVMDRNGRSNYVGMGVRFASKRALMMATTTEQVALTSMAWLARSNTMARTG